MYTPENSYALRNKGKVLNGINSRVVCYLSEKLLTRYFHRAYLYQENNMDMDIPGRKHIVYIYA